MDENFEFFEEENEDIGPKGKKKKEDGIIPISTVVDNMIPDPKMLYVSKSKLTHNFLNVLSKIVDDETGSAAWMTWKELVMLVNLNLPTDEQITLHTWKDWVKKADNGESMATNEVFETFKQIIDLVRLKKKMNIINNIQNGKNVRGNAWLLSRSAQFREEFGNEDKGKGGDTNIQINLMM